MADSMEAEQLSFFSMLALPQIAVCCMDGKAMTAEPAESWMTRLVPGGEYLVQVAGHPLVLRPAENTEETIPDGHRYYHYTIGNRLFSGVFVGRAST